MALVITLSLLVLITVLSVAFLSNVLDQQLATTADAGGERAEVCSQGATAAIIANLQGEMYAGSPNKNAAAPIVMTLDNNTSITPSRVVSNTITTAPDTTGNPNAPYYQYVNLVKQSLPASQANQSTLYPNGPALPASSVPTTRASSDGRFHNGSFWNLPKLISSATTDPLVPNWVYVARDGTNPTDLTKSPASPTLTGSPNGGYVTGRYAYNVYDIGGLLNANVAGYGQTTGLTPAVATPDQQLVPGYKGTSLTADLSGLTLNGTLKNASGGAVSSPANWQYILPQWREKGMWPTTLPMGFGYLLSGGEQSGWLYDSFLPFDLNHQPGSTFTPVGSPANPLSDFHFTSRQDLINWTSSYLAKQSGTDMTWVLPYLTHFSFDTDAPTFAPSSNSLRPKILLAASAGGSDGFGGDVPGPPASSYTNINPAFTSILDANGQPLVKQRFPLSAISLVDQFYPGNPGPASGTPLYNQIQYDFGLVWDAAKNCWDYQDVEGGSSPIKRLSSVPNTRSPNFFELLKAAIVAGSLGKQYGNNGSACDIPSSTYPSTPANYANVFSGGNYSTKYASVDYQVIQIGANILSQANINHIPTDITFNTVHFWGVSDLPYLYRARAALYDVALCSGFGQMYDPYSKRNAMLIAMMLQPELWDPHAPNAIGADPNAVIPGYFRVVPKTISPVGIGTFGAVPNTPTGRADWPFQGTSPYISGTVSNYTAGGGTDCSLGIKYVDDMSAYIQVGPWDPKGTTLASFREPIPLMEPNFPINNGVFGVPNSPTGTPTSTVSQPLAQLTFFQGTNTSWPSAPAINPLDTHVFTSTPANPVQALGFLIGYFYSGPSLVNITTPGPVPQAYPDMGYGRQAWLYACQESGGPMVWELYYGMSASGPWYQYDQMDSVMPSYSGLTTMAQVTQTIIGTRFDPRTGRWGMSNSGCTSDQGPNGIGLQNNYISGFMQGQTGAPYLNAALQAGGENGGTPPASPGWAGGNNYQVGYLQVNKPILGTYYADPDGVVRPGDGAGSTANSAPGFLLASAESLAGMNLSAINKKNTDPGLTPVGNYDNRPVILNRPFQSVAELGYVFRDTPWRSLDFNNAESGDTALLDTFCVYGPDPWSYASKTYNGANTSATFLNASGLVAGKVNLNTQQAPVLAALLKGAFLNTPTSATPVTLSDATASSVAQALAAYTAPSASNYSLNQGPLLNRAEMVGKWQSGTTYTGFSSKLAALLPSGEPAVIKQQRECVTHALADAGTTRTWNLLIDLVAQSGTLVTNATTLDRFNVAGEHHVWVSVAIDRATGKVIKIQNEPVNL